VHGGNGRGAACPVRGGRGIGRGCRVAGARPVHALVLSPRLLLLQDVGGVVGSLVLQQRDSGNLKHRHTPRPQDNTQALIHNTPCCTSPARR
jgi:hypothetical protein